MCFPSLYLCKCVCKTLLGNIEKMLSRLSVAPGVLKFASLLRQSVQYYAETFVIPQICICLIRFSTLHAKVWILFKASLQVALQLVSFLESGQYNLQHTFPVIATIQQYRHNIHNIPMGHWGTKIFVGQGQGQGLLRKEGPPTYAILSWNLALSRCTLFLNESHPAFVEFSTKAILLS